MITELSLQACNSKAYWRLMTFIPSILLWKLQGLMKLWKIYTSIWETCQRYLMIQAFIIINKYLLHYSIFPWIWGSNCTLHMAVHLYKIPLTGIWYYRWIQCPTENPPSQERGILHNRLTRASIMHNYNGLNSSEINF